MSVVALLIPVLLVCAAASPSSRRALGRWAVGVSNALVPRGWLLGCGVWLLLFWLVGGVIFCGWAVILIASPGLAIADWLGWLAARREPR